MSVAIGLLKRDKARLVISAGGLYTKDALYRLRILETDSFGLIEGIKEL